MFNLKNMTKEKLLLAAPFIEQLIFVAFKIDDKLNQVKERTEQIKRMASLARQGLKDSDEFKELERKYRHPKVIPFDDEMYELQKIVKLLRKYDKKRSS